MLTEFTYSCAVQHSACNPSPNKIIEKKMAVKVQSALKSPTRIDTYSDAKVSIIVKAIALCPYALDEIQPADEGEGEGMGTAIEIGIGIAGLVARDCIDFKRDDEVWSRMPVSLRPDVEHVSLNADSVFKLAPGITLEQAATLGDSGLMALHAVEVAGAKPGCRLLIHGAANPFGSAAISLASHLGASVVATVDLVREQRLAIVAGATHVALARARDVSQTLHKWINSDPKFTKHGASVEGGIHAIIDGAFVENAALNLALLAPGGRIVTCRMKDNARKTAETEDAFASAMAKFAKKNIEVKILSLQDLGSARGVNIPRMAKIINNALASRRYQPVVGQVLSPTELGEAMAMLNHGHSVGSLILKTDSISH